MSTYLKHHGILGQKWGVRRYQNKDGTLTQKGRERYKNDIVIAKGSHQKHVSLNPRLKLEDRETYTYDPNDEHDRKVYEGPFSEYLSTARSFFGLRSDVYVYDYVTKEDLISPNAKKRVDIFVDSFKNKPANYISELNGTMQYWANVKNAGYSVTENNERLASAYNSGKRLSKNTPVSELRDYGYDAAMATAELGTLRSKATKTYFDSVKKAGYNALVDDHNKGIYNDAHQPLISLSGKNSLMQMSVSKLNSEDQQKNLKDIRDYMMKKYGRGAAL